MGSGLQTNDPTVVAAFHAALVHQLIVLGLLAAVLAVAWNVVNTIRYKRSAAIAAGAAASPVAEPLPYPEPIGRHLLRIGFGILWIIDSLLQAQSSMPLGLPSGVITPAAASSPGWVHHVVSAGTTIWADHPVSAAASAIWIQLGIGAFLLVAPRGYWSRAAGVLSVGWGLVVWMFGEAFGGIFGQGSSWLIGSPGAAVFYVLAGVLVALPESAWETPRLGNRLLRVTGAFFVGMGVLQAWPGRGYWTGHPHRSGAPGALASMLDQMAKVPQPSVTASSVRWFASLDTAHGWAVNLVVVVSLVGIGACLLSGRSRPLRIGTLAVAVVCLADWILVQDLGIFGGVGTDPNSMIPMALVCTAAYFAVVRVPVAIRVGPAAGTSECTAVPVGPAVLLDRVSPSYVVRSLAAVGAVGILLVGAAPMALAATNPNADPILTEAQNGTPNVVNEPASPFTLTNQTGGKVSLRSLAGHTVILTFLDPVCTSDCPLIAQELRVADQLLGPAAAHVDLVAIVNNPLYSTTALTNAFDRQEGLDHLANWQFLTGPLPVLDQVWSAYGVQTQVSPAGAMTAHSDVVYLLDGNGRIREVLNSSPGSTPASYSSFSALLAGQAQRLAAS